MRPPGGRSGIEPPAPVPRNPAQPHRNVTVRHQKETRVSHRLYANDAERQRAYRERQRLEHARADTGPPRARAPAPREAPRSARLRATQAEVRKLAAEYQNWLDHLPTNLAEGKTAADLEEVIAQLEEAAELLEDIDLPAVGKPARVNGGREM